ncbi:hypothetical protein CCY99_07265 [Helicobacter sp. 16-1353]|uniref:hypothetical protein n=1 Tax=Helicobacter sp. 16-1353 TaxID=2004996 RepID=UPI000DCC838A|nr:hypothetical protein [Helicobacter sp. 16-1353]RAX52441.1 hypothetical protein CCY99_07265 [Helicobacter sp. 16-1353]
MTKKNLLKGGIMGSFASFIYRAILRTDSKLLERILLRLRRLMLKFTNPLICLEYGGFRLILPLSHTIFYNQKIYPNYDRELHHIGKFIKSKYGFLNMVDVGANIGDTAVFTNIKDANYLLIEGEKSYESLIKANLSLNYGTDFSQSNGGGYNH